MKRTKWFERKFPQQEDSGILPCIIERLAGTSIRLQDKISRIAPNILGSTSKGHWSIKKEIGHLIDLEPLWLGRIKDIMANEEFLREADLRNTKTHEANHDEQDVFELIKSFKTHRTKLLSLLGQITESDLTQSAKHPRLLTPMKIIDLSYFVAEHDDHHLAQITYLSKSSS